MKINVLFSPVNADELYFTNKTIVVIDVLRASSTIITALSNGAKEIVPVATVEFAVKVSGGMFGGQTLIGGERKTRKIDGFALGNSPFEYSREVVENKFIVFFSTNGSKAIVKAKFAESLFVCSFINLSSVVKHLISLNRDIEILCAGNNNLFSLEDSVCAGKLIAKLKKKNKKIEITDSGSAALALFDRFGENIFNMLKNTEHGVKLAENGFEKDVKYCSENNTSDCIPSMDGKVLRAFQPEDNN
ncbi:2-phosphosulfolactate phosphatase [Bacteroidota bacterium]